jgi:hypothetical protein
MKSPNPIAADVPRIFSDDRVRELVPAKLKIPAEAMPRFAGEIRRGALIFFEDAGKATGNEVHHEIADLVRAALLAARARMRPDAAREKVARLIERLSPQARKIMNQHGTLPDPATLRDPAAQREVCEAVARRGRRGAYLKLGRKREGGKRSVTEVSVLNAPTLEQYPSRREGPPHAFVGWVEAAYIQATGKKPPRTANRANPGPYARFVQACLDELRASADAVDLINLRCWQTRIMQLRHVARRWDTAVAAARLSGQFP